MTEQPAYDAIVTASPHDGAPEPDASIAPGGVWPPFGADARDGRAVPGVTGREHAIDAPPTDGVRGRRPMAPTTIITTRWVLPALALAGLAATACPPARAAVIETGPVAARFAQDLGFRPVQNGLAFDAGLGTIDAVTLRFSGTAQVSLDGLVFDPRAQEFPAATTAAVSVSYVASLDAGTERVVAQVPARVGVSPVVVSASFSTQRLSAAGSAAVEFAFDMPGARWEEGVFYADARFAELERALVDPIGDAVLTGRATAVFSYTPAGGGAQPVPEPAALALVGVAVAGLAALRRR